MKCICTARSTAPMWPIKWMNAGLRKNERRGSSCLFSPLNFLFTPPLFISSRSYFYPASNSSACYKKPTDVPRTARAVWSESLFCGPVTGYFQKRITAVWVLQPKLIFSLAKHQTEVIVLQMNCSGFRFPPPEIICGVTTADSHQFLLVTTQLVPEGGEGFCFFMWQN